MGWIGNFLFCAGSMTVTGSVAFLIYSVARHFLKGKAPRLRLWMARVTVILYLAPIVYVLLWIKNWYYTGNTWAHRGEFTTSTTSMVIFFYRLVAIIWLILLLDSTIDYWKKYIGLRKLLNENGPVMDERWERILDESCERYRIKRKPPVYQNAHVKTPFVVPLYRHLTIVLPMKEYTEQQMRMMMDHEVNHIRSRDVIWEELANAVVWLHCINRLGKLLRERLSREQEVECDFFVCQNSEHYTAHEYFGFMGSLPEESKKKNVFMMSMLGSGKEIMERMEEIKMRSKTQKVSKWAILVCCVVMCLCSVATAYAASNVAMGVEEDMVYHTERISIGKSVMDDHEEIHFIETEGSVVEEIFLDEETSPYSSYIQVNTSIPAHTRVSWKKQSMVVGDQVTISIHCEGSGVYWIGIKEIDTGYVYCIEGTGTLTHTFSVPVKGNYRAFIENRSDNEELYRGFIVYPYD